MSTSVSTVDSATVIETASALGNSGMVDENPAQKNDAEQIGGAMMKAAPVVAAINPVAGAVVAVVGALVSFFGGMSG
jgi:hypothetical protein